MRRMILWGVTCAMVVSVGHAAGTATGTVSSVGSDPLPAGTKEGGAVTAAVAVVSTNPAVAAVRPAPDPMVGKVLLSLATYLQSARHFQCEVSFRICSEMEGMKQEISATYALAVAKPNKLSLRHLKGMAGNTVVCDGAKLITYAAMLNRYEEREAPKSLEQFSQGVGPMSGNMLFVDNLLRDDIYAAVMDGVTGVTYAGRESVDGVECDRLKFVQDQFDWDLWVATGSKPVVVQVLSDMSKGLSPVAEGAPKGMKMTVLNRFANWAVDTGLAPDAFDLKLPPGARKSESLFEGEDNEPVDGPAAPPVDAAKQPAG